MAWLLFACLFAAEPELIEELDGPRFHSPTESAQEKQVRRAEVQKKRADVLLLVDGGATEFAPSGSAPAIEAAMDLGASGVRLTIRKTPMGPAAFADASSFPLFESVDPPALLVSRKWFPPFSDPRRRKSRFSVAMLDHVVGILCKRAALVDFVLEDPSMTGEVLTSLKKAEALDHVVGIHNADAALLAQAGNDGLRLVATREELSLREDDFEPSDLKPLVRKWGEPIVVRDPRLALSLMGRPPRRVRIDGAVSAWGPQGGAPVNPEIIALLAAFWTDRSKSEDTSPRHRRSELFEWGRRFGESISSHQAVVTGDVSRQIHAMLADPDRGVRSEAILAIARIRLVSPLSAAKKELQRLEEEWNGGKLAPADVASILAARGRIALALSLAPGEVDGDAILIGMLERPTPTDDPLWAGIDAAAAARALGRRHAKTAVGSLKAALLKPIVRDAKSADAVARERIARESAIALAAIGGDAAIVALETAMNLPPEERVGRPKELASIAASALARFNVLDRAPILAKLIVHGLPEVRREGILGCLREPGLQYRTLLELSADWAVPWWDVQHRPK